MIAAAIAFGAFVVVFAILATVICVSAVMLGTKMDPREEQ